MDNLGDMISSVLSDPEAVARLRETARQLGLDDTLRQHSDQSEPAAHSGNAENTGNSGGQADNAAAPLGGLLPMLGKLQQDDDMSRLIHALKPFLTGSRLKKAEEADKIMVILRLIPMLQAQGKDSASP